MTLAGQDLTNIKAVVDARADLQDEKLRQVAEIVREVKERLGQVEENMATKEQLEQVKEMLEGDDLGIVKDVTELKARSTALESRHA